MLLGVVLHGAISLMYPNLPFWPIQDSDQTILLALPVFLIHSFRLQTFFLMAGFFAALVIDRKGAREFVVHRLKRVALPLVVFTIVLVPIIQMFFVVGLADLPRGLIPFGETGIQYDTTQLATTIEQSLTISHFIGNFHFFHLWFLWYLIWMYAISMAVYIGAQYMPLVNRMLRSVSKLFRIALLSRFRSIYFALLTVPVLFFMRTWTPDAPEKAMPQIEQLLYWSLFFGLGWLLYVNREQLSSLGKGWKWHAVAAIGLTVPLIALMQFGPMNPDNYRPEFHVPAILSYAIYSWLMIIAFCGFFMEKLDGPSPSLRYISDSSYWVYLAHLPVVMGFQMLVARWSMNPILKFMIVMVFSVLVLYLSYQWLVRHSFVGRMLNGSGRPAITSETRR